MERTTRVRGASLPELLITALLLSFIVGSVARLYSVGKSSHQVSRGYSQNQTDLRTAMRRATRTIRHGGAPVATTTDFGGGTQASDGTQVILQIPDSSVKVRVYYKSGSLYAQRSDESAPGTQLITGLTIPSGQQTFRYYQSAGTAPPADVSGSPATATEVKISLWSVRERVQTGITTYVALRNRIAGSF